MSATCRTISSVFAVFDSASISDVVDKKHVRFLMQKQIFKSKPLNANLWGRVERRFENCLKDMSRMSMLTLTKIH